MVWRRRSRNICEVLVTQSELSRIGKVCWNVSLNELLSDRSRLTSQPSAVSVVRVSWGRIWRPRHIHPVNAGKCAEVIVEGVVLLENNHYAIDLARSRGA